jgi:hypothetical protein
MKDTDKKECLSEDNKKARNAAMTAFIKDTQLIGSCGCRFESEHSNTVILCEECSELPCHNKIVPERNKL